LTDQRFRHDQQDALCALRSALRNDQASLNRLSQANLVRENATAFAKASKRKDYSVYLVRVWINSRLSLSGSVAFPVVRATDTNEILRKDALIKWVECCHPRSY
jgi:hypothetical protein